MSNKIQSICYAALPYQTAISTVILLALMLAPAGLLWR